MGQIASVAGSLLGTSINVNGGASAAAFATLFQMHPAFALALVIIVICGFVATAAIAAVAHDSAALYGVGHLTRFGPLFRETAPRIQPKARGKENKSMK
jgi:hypothetical protein